MNESNNTNDSLHAPTSIKEKSFFFEIIRFAFFAVIIVVPFRLFVAQPFVVQGASMDPTFETGEYLIVDQLSHRFEAPARDSVVIFKYPKDPSKYFIKRIIGLPGETVEIEGTKVTIKNTANPQGFVLEEPYVEIHHQNQDFISETLASDEYFVMGDNRSGSSDSRAWGPVKESLIIGRPFVRLLPLKTFQMFPGDVKSIY